MDPHLHTHVLIPNMAKGPDGRWTALEHPPIYEYAKTVGSLYEAFLRHEVVERLPWVRWKTPTNGIAELVEDQVPEMVRTALSKRTAQIAERERELALAGYNLDAKGHELAGRTSRDCQARERAG